MQASKAADTYGLFEGRDVQQADSRQAYSQPMLGGTPTWVRLPKEAWPESWAGMIDPLCPLLLALHGHPDADGFWEQHCEAHVMSKGFVPITCWRSCYYHPELELFLIVYADFKLAGPSRNLGTGWNLILSPFKTAPEGIDMDPPTP
eukprot:29295-Pyramimonas_sp.AAC.1